MSMDHIKTQLLGITNLEDGSEDQDFLQTLVTAVESLPEKDWDALDNETQVWANVASYCKDKGNPIPGFGDEEEFEKRKAEMEEADAVQNAAKKKSVGVGAPVAKKKKVAAATPTARKTEKKDKKPVETKKASNGAAAGGKGRRSKFQDTATINVLLESNPHRPNTHGHKVFALYKDGMSVKDFIKKCTPDKSGGSTPRAYLSYHTSINAISVSSAD